MIYFILFYSLGMMFTTGILISISVDEPPPKSIRVGLVIGVILWPMMLGFIIAESIKD